MVQKVKLKTKTTWAGFKPNPTHNTCKMPRPVVRNFAHTDGPTSLFIFTFGTPKTKAQ
jgi:hypothetical protein